ncbi:nuclease domain-containing protein [Bisbaumannia pacifica]|uniref:DUF1364 family protein n=1 Tax=Bisbaumannia pacifica TaxID=77098 RepID=A0ABD4KWV6_9GAMM|nr:nuclease domain-containing protein [Halomonas pacifica]MBH8578773.1 DUF1364 family protein [Halomonas pacifica]
MLKRQRIESQHIRQAARGESCTVEILGTCNRDPATVVLAHLPDESHGMARKSDDISAAFCCSSCHDVLDGRAPWPDQFEASYREWYMRRGMARTWRRLVELGVVTIKGVK